MILRALFSVSRFNHREQTIKEFKNVWQKIPQILLLWFEIRMKTICSKQYFVSIIEQCKQNQGMDLALLFTWEEIWPMYLMHICLNRQHFCVEYVAFKIQIKVSFFYFYLQVTKCCLVYFRFYMYIIRMYFSIKNVKTRNTHIYFYIDLWLVCPW